MENELTIEVSPAVGSDLPPSPTGRPPTGAVAFGLSGAILIALESMLYIAFGNWFYPLNAIGSEGLIAAIALALVSGALYVIPRSHATAGVLMITFSLLSLYGGGGFIIGAILGWIGGVLAVGYRPVGWVEGATRLSRSDVQEDPVIAADLEDAGLLSPAARRDPGLKPSVGETH